MTAKPKPMTVSSFALGMNNRRPDFKLKRIEAPFGTYMREIVNCDISDRGVLSRRRGYAKLVPMTVGGSLWANDYFAYCASGTSMLMVTDTASVVATTAVGGASLVSAAPVSFSASPFAGAYWTDGASLGYVSGTSSAPVAPPQPLAWPTVSVGAGALEAGIYSVAFTYVDSAGRESPASPTNVFAVNAGAALTFTLPVTPAYQLKVYVSLPNGTEMYAALQFNGNGAQTVSSVIALGAACTTVGLANMPAGRFVRYSLGRLLVAVGSTLFYSLPYMPGLYDPTAGFIQFPAEITVMEPFEAEGLFVVADQTYWLAGDLANAKLETISTNQGVMGSGAQRSDNAALCWMSTRGLSVATSGGKVITPQDEAVAVAVTATGASIFMDRGGVPQIISTLNGASRAVQSEGSVYAGADVGGETWAMNLDNGASRLYRGHAFTSYAQIAGRYFGIRADGLYLLEGDTDAGAEIDASVNIGRQDFASLMRKRMEAAYLTVGSTGVMHLAITNDSGESYTYDARRSDASMQQERIDVGRGLNGVWMNFTVTNDTGCAFELNGFELLAVETARRLR